MIRATGTPCCKAKLTPFLAGAVFAAIIVVPAFAQMGSAGGELQRKLAVLKQSVDENQQRLHHFQWTETQAFVLKGEPRPSRQFVCSYGPDGKVHRNLIGPPPESPSGGRKEKAIEKKKEEMQDYMEGVKMLLGLYVPPDPLSLQRAFDKGNVSLSLFPGAQDKSFVFKNYAQPGDEMTVTFDSAAKKVVTISVNTYMDDPKDVVALTIQFASLPDGTNYMQQAVVNATGRQIVVTLTNSNYQPV
ncbi:MAG: hypothetical protein ABSD20_06480 [Terriglobales bacterium]|jgi:hypothetical protein